MAQEPPPTANRPRRLAKKVRNIESRGKVRIDHALDEVDFGSGDPVWCYVEDGRIVIDGIEKP